MPVRRHGLVDLQPARRPTSSSGPARSSRTSSSPTRSTAPRRRRRRRCSRRCRSGRSRSTATTHPLERAVPRARDAEPDRVRGHVPAARGAARPVPPAPRRRLPRARGRVAGARAPARARGRTRSSSSRSSTRRRSLAMQRSLEQVHVSEQVGLYMVDLVAATRESPRVQVGASPRGTLALLKLSRGRAALSGRDFVTPDDVKAVAVPALAPPADAAAGALGAARARRRPRARGARVGADASRRGAR